jgi:hypothetical protein
MRALPALSLEYFGKTAFGNTASLGVAGAEGLPVAVAGGFAGRTGAAAGLVATTGDDPVPHSALRKSFHFMPLSVPAVCAALYWHCAQASSAPSDELPKAIAPRSAPVQMATRRVVMAGLPCADLSDKSPIAAVRH